MDALESFVCLLAVLGQPLEIFIGFYMLRFGRTCLIHGHRLRGDATTRSGIAK